MPTVQIEAQLSPAQLLQAAEQLSLSELEELESRLRTMAARRKAPGLSRDETRLMLAVHQTLPCEKTARYDILLKKRQDGALTPDEQSELLRLGDERESHWAKRMAAAAELAKMRGVSLTVILQQLDITVAPVERLVV